MLIYNSINKKVLFRICFLSLALLLVACRVKYIREGGSKFFDTNLMALFKFGMSDHKNSNTHQVSLEEEVVNIDQEYFNEKTLIHAAYNGKSSIVNKLLKHGDIDVNAQDTHGKTALICATLRGHLKIVVALLKYGNIDINAQDEHGKTALMYAAQHRHLEVVRVLLGHENINVNVQDKKGMTALICAVQNDFQNVLEIVSALLEHSGINVHVEDKKLKTALIHAAAHADQQVVERLLDKKAYINHKDKHSRTPLILAAVNGRGDILECLLERGANADIADTKSGNTALMHAISGRRIRDIALFRLLAEKTEKLALCRKNKRGNTACAMALKQKKNDRVMQEVHKIISDKIRPLKK